MRIPEIIKNILCSIKGIIIVIAITILLFEISLQIILYYNHDLARKLLYSSYLFREYRLTEIFLKNYERNLKDPSDEHFAWSDEPYEVHKTRGWTTRKNVKTFHQTNNMGHRNYRDYIYNRNQFAIVTLGDSFTFGTEAKTKDIWPILLEGKSKYYQVVNLGVGGYGIDQMYITLKETIKSYKPNIVLLAYIADDLKRSLYKFNGYEKPRFILMNNRLINKNPYIGNVEQTYNMIKEDYDILTKKNERKFLFPAALNNLYAILINKFFNSLDNELEKINTRLIEEIFIICKRENAELLLIHLGSGKGLMDINFKDKGEIFLEQYILTHKVEYIKSRELFANADKSWAPGHYQRQENEYLAEIIHRKIQKMSSWNNWVSNSGKK